MGLEWLFGKKKVLPKVPLPEGQPFDDRTFQFSKRYEGETVIEPGNLQAAAGFNQPYSVPESSPRAPSMTSTPSATAPEAQYQSEPIYIKVDAYQRILGEIEDLKKNLASLQESHRKVESSEYNKENHFEKLKKSMKQIHDRLLLVDKTLFKYQGE